VLVPTLNTYKYWTITIKIDKKLKIQEVRSKDIKNKEGNPRYSCEWKLKLDLSCIG
jgi:hypothetical protein